MREPAVGIVCPTHDGQYWLGGMHYLQHLIRAVESLPEDEQLAFRDVWWASRPAKDPFAELRSALDGSVLLRMPIGYRRRLLRRVHRLLSGYRRQDLADLFYRAGIHALFPVLPCDNCGVPFVYWITDLQYRHQPQLYTEQQWQWFEDQYRVYGALAARVVLMSKDTLRDVRQFMPELAEKARVVSPCSVPAPSWWENDPATVAKQYSLGEKFFLVSNQVCSHKNHHILVEAVAILRGRGLEVDVVCTGRAHDYRDPAFYPKLQAEIARRGVQERFRFLDAIPRADQIALMRRAVAVLQPSRFEGWGLAISDAKAVGKPILASDLAVHHEHNASRIAYLPVDDAEAWAAAIAQAHREWPPGPVAKDEERARLEQQTEICQVGRTVVALFREIVPGLSRPAEQRILQKAASR